MRSIDIVPIKPKLLVYKKEAWITFGVRTTGKWKCILNIQFSLLDPVGLGNDSGLRGNVERLLHNHEYPCNRLWSAHVGLYPQQQGDYGLLASNLAEKTQSLGSRTDPTSKE